MSRIPQVIGLHSGRFRMFSWTSAASILLLLFHLLAAVGAAQSKVPIRVLILNQENPGWPIFRTIDENVRGTLRSGLPQGTLIFSEHMDLIHFSDPLSQAQLAAWIQRKYSNPKLDLIVGVGDVPIDMFPGVPLVYLSVAPQQKRPSSLVSSKDLASIWVELDVRKALEVARLGSLLINRQLTAWESYKYYILGTIFLALVEALLIAALLWQRTARREVKSDLIVAHDRLRSAMESGKAVGWERDVRSGQGSWVGDLKTIFGIPTDTYFVRPEDFHRYVHPEDRQQVSQAVADAEKNHSPYAAEFRVVWPDGTVRWVAASGKFYYSLNGEPERMLGMAVDITDRKQLENKLHESQDRMGSIVASAMDAIIAIDDAQRIVLFNASAEKMFSCRAEDAVGSPIERFIPQRFRAAHSSHIRQFGETGISGRNMGTLATLWALRANGDEFPIEASISHVNAAGKKFFTVILRDITDRRRAEQALAQSQERFSKAFRQSPMLLTLSNANDHRYIEVNETFERITGWRRDEVIGRTALDLGFWVDPAQRVDVMKRLLAEGSLRNLEARFCMRDGSIRIGQVSAEMIELDGQPCALGVIADITERKNAEEALRESEARFRLVANTAPVLIWISDTEKLCTYFNAPWLDFTGRSIESELGNGWAEGVHPEDFNGCLETYTKAFDRRERFSMEYRLRRHDGEYRWVLDIGVPRFNEDGSFAGFIGSGVDVTDRKAAEEALRENEDKLRLLLDSTAEAIYGIDLEGRCTFCNLACLRALGYQRVDYLLGRNMHDLIHHSRADGTRLPAETGRIMRALQTGQGVHVDDEVLWDAKGTSFPAEYWSYPQRKGQEVVGAVVTFLDITERKRTEVVLENLSRKLIGAQEQERSRIARELHDDIGQRLALLTVELGQFPLDSTDLPADVGSRIDELRKQASEIAADVQSLSHELHSSKLEYLGIATAMRGFCREFSAQQNVEIVFVHDAIPRAVPSDISLCLFRVLQEALHNAVKYSGVQHFDAELRASSDAIDLTVRDSGSSFDVEEAMKTSGLGLVSMGERIKLVGGQLSIESHPGSGTTIHASVPLREAARAAP